MNAVSRFLLALGCLVLAVPSLFAAPIPESWSNQDLPQGPSPWYAVEVARFPSAALAEGVGAQLRSLGWGPVELMAEKGETRVLVGEVENAGSAWFLREELAAQQIADGKVVRIPAGTNARLFSGKISQPFLVEFDLSPDEQQKFAGEVMAALADLTADATAASATAMRTLVEAMEAGDMRKPGVAAPGAVVAASMLYDQRAQGDVALYLASRVASGEWPTISGGEEDLLKARNITFELLQGHRRDWAAAWNAAREMERLYSARPEVVALARLRRASLMVELVEQGREPAPSLADVRLMLRSAYELAPGDDPRLQARIELVYIQSFAWEGNWARTEAVVRTMWNRVPTDNPHHALARVYLARSIERRREYQNAIDILTQVINTPFGPDDYLRYGMESLNPADAARASRRQFQDLAMADGVYVVFQDVSRPTPADAADDEKAAGDDTTTQNSATEED